MTKQEAITAMCEGKKVTHRYFTSDEWVKSNQNGTIYILEDGVECSSFEFWRWRTDEAYLSDWEIFIEQKDKEYVDKFIEHFSKVPNEIPFPTFCEDKGSNFIPQRGGSNQSWKNKGKGRKF